MLDVQAAPAMSNPPPTLTRDECVALSRLSDAESAAIAADPTLAERGPVALMAYLVRIPDGSMRPSRFIEDDLDAALAAKDHVEAARLKSALRCFLRGSGPI